MKTDRFSIRDAAQTITHIQDSHWVSFMCVLEAEFKSNTAHNISAYDVYFIL